jgi:hypothetical protein
MVAPAEVAMLLVRLAVLLHLEVMVVLRVLQALVLQELDQAAEAAVQQPHLAQVVPVELS